MLLMIILPIHSDVGGDSGDDNDDDDGGDGDGDGGGDGGGDCVDEIIHCLIVDNKYSTVRYGTVQYCIFIEYMPTGKTNIP